MSRSLEQIIGAFDALDAGDVGIFQCSDGSLGAHIPTVDVRGKHTVSSLAGYSATVEGALIDLWVHATSIEPDECLLVRVNGGRRGYRWNGHAFKHHDLPPAPEDAS